MAPKKITTQQNRNELTSTIESKEAFLKNHGKEISKADRGKIESSISARKGTLAGLSESGRTAKYTGKGKTKKKFVATKR